MNKWTNDSCSVFCAPRQISHFSFANVLHLSAIAGKEQTSLSQWSLRIEEHLWF